MSGRCKACNALLTEQELCTQYPDSREYIELCFKCLDASEEGEETFEEYEEELYDECHT